MDVHELRVMGRATQGVRLIRLDDDDEIASVAKVEVQDEVEKPEGIEPPAKDEGNTSDPDSNVADASPDAPVV